VAATHILVTTDLSDDAQRAFPHAMALARSNRAKVTLLHVVEVVRAVPHGAPFAPSIPDPGMNSIMEDAEATLVRMSATFEGIAVMPVVVLAGDVGATVAREAAERGCDLIVLSTHGRTGFRRLVLGSMAESILRHSHVPVLAIPPSEAAAVTD
jgi:nucleotide-binding universal stress UspA family protein